MAANDSGRVAPGDQRHVAPASERPASAGAARVEDPGRPRATSAGEDPPRRGGKLALSTAFFSFATGLSRVAGLAREVVAASYFGVTGTMSAFTIAFQVPNLVRALFADMALQGAFVPVFTDLLERGERREAFRVASSLFFLITLVLGGITALLVLAAPAVIPVVAPGFDDDPALRDLTVALSRVLFPIVVLLGLSGLVVGMLNSFEHFSVPALAPLAWNLVIIGALVGLTPAFPEEDQIYAYAIGVLAGTVVQLLLPTPWLRGRGGRLTLTLDWRSPHVRRVLALMLPVTITLGLINFSLLVNSFFGTLVSEQAPAAIDKAFRIYMLPQGIFSIAIATILFPTLSRFAARGALDDMRRTMANGVRQIGLLLIPSAAILAVLAEPITRLVYERGVFGAAATDLVSEAMLVWAFSLPFQGASLLYSRTFFSLQRPWTTTALAGASLLVNALVALALYRPLGISGVVLGTVVATIGLSVAQAVFLSRDLDGVEARKTASATVRMLVAAAALALVAFLAWRVLDEALGRSLAAQVVSVGSGIVAGLAVYTAIVFALRVPEARQIARLVAERLPRRG
ncbi:MAG: murein biosynthesis integral membrane protein MurJ [Thermoleophilaceae bacterium]|nr:murein biosynthesis integral membrane protein MurJ [Thermoleophilaceae bacterium]